MKAFGKEAFCVHVHTSIPENMRFTRRRNEIPFLLSQSLFFPSYQPFSISPPSFHMKASYPDEPFHNFGALKSVARRS